VGARSFLEDGALLFGGLDAERALAGHLFSLLEGAVSTKNAISERRECINEIKSRTTKSDLLVNYLPPFLSVPLSHGPGIISPAGMFVKEVGRVLRLGCLEAVSRG
jgi:GNAT acetyltransferase-like protein